MDKPEVITAWATVGLAGFTVLLVLVTAWFMWRQERRQSELHGLDILMKLREAFHSDEFRCARQIASQVLLRNFGNSQSISESNELGVLITHFERIGYFTKRDVLNEDLAWFTFSHHVIHYYPCVKGYIQKRQETSPMTWEHVAWFYQKMIDVERRKWKTAGRNLEEFGKYAHPDNDVLKEFLKSESALDRDVKNGRSAGNTPAQTATPGNSAAP